MTYALIFPGQGSQETGMGKDFYDAFSSARDVFHRADQALGFSLSNIIFNGPEEELRRTAFTQPAILTVSIAVLECLRREAGISPTPLFLAGHSLGEYTALVASGVLSLEDGVRLVHLRGRLMQEATPVGIGGMSALISRDLDIDMILEALRDLPIDVANIKSLVRINRMGRSKDFLRECLIEGGLVETGLLLDLHGEEPSVVADSLRYTAYARLAEEGLKTGSRFELLADNFTMASLRSAMHKAFGPEPVIGYILAKETEIRNLRVILTGKINGLPAGAIRERLRDTYV